MNFYNPNKFKSDDVDAALALMNAYPFATLLSIVGGEPFVSHLPLLTERNQDKIILTGHMSRANQHWKHLDGGATAVFHGPHAFITPKWYAKNDVPTWNYSVVHVRGQIKLIEDFSGISTCLQKLTTYLEKNWPSGWEFWIPPDLGPEALPRQIVGFEVVVDDIAHKAKLSQNRSPEDRKGVMQGLATRLDEQSRLVLADMQNLYDDQGELSSSRNEVL